MYISPEEFSKRHCMLKQLEKNSSPNTTIYRSVDNKLVKKIKFLSEDDFRQWIKCLEFEIEKQNDQAKLFPNHVLGILDHSYEKKGNNFKFYITYNCNPERTYSLDKFVVKENQKIKQTLKILEIAMMLKNSGVCHNNIKPSNLIIHQNETETDFQILLTDYGSTRTHDRNYLNAYLSTKAKYWQNKLLFYQCRDYLMLMNKNEEKSNLNWQNIIKPNNIEPDIWGLGIIILQLFQYSDASEPRNLTSYYGIDNKDLRGKITRLRVNYQSVADALEPLLLDKKYDISLIYKKFSGRGSLTPNYMKCKQADKKYQLELFYAPSKDLTIIKDNTRQFKFNERKSFITSKFNIPIQQISNESAGKSICRMYSNELEQFIPNNDNEEAYSPSKFTENNSSLQQKLQIIDINNQVHQDQFQNHNDQLNQSQVIELIKLDEIGQVQDQKIDSINARNENAQQREVEQNNQIIIVSNVHVAMQENSDKDEQYLVSRQQFQALGNQETQQEYLVKLFDISLQSVDRNKQFYYLSALNYILENQYQDVDVQLFMQTVYKQNEDELNQLYQFIIQKGELNVPLQYIQYLKAFPDRMQQSDYDGYILQNKYHGLGRMSKDEKEYWGIFHLGRLLWGSVFEVDYKQPTQYIKSIGTFDLETQLMNGSECEIQKYYQLPDQTFKLIEHYKGSMVKGIIQGKGVKITQSMKYTGDWKNGFMEGDGAQTNLIGTKQEYLYIGEFKQDKYEGYGIKYFGTVFQKGQYKNGKAIGEHITKSELQVTKVNHDNNCIMF